MRDPNRIPRILAKLEHVWKESPDLRLGQLMVCLVGRPSKGFDIFGEEDDKLEGVLDDWLRAEYEERTEGHYHNLFYE